MADGSYPGSRPLFIYVKKVHVGVVPGLAEYVAEFLKGAADGGYLNAKGLIVSPKAVADTAAANGRNMTRSEEQTSELQSLMRISYAVFCLKKKKNKQKQAPTSKELQCTT